VAVHLVVESTRGRSPRSLNRNRLDLLGLALLGMAVAWASFVAMVSGGDPDPFIALLLAVVCALILGRIVDSVHRALVPGIVVAFAAVLATRTPDLLSAAPLSGPFGYANAKGAFFFQAAVAGLMLASASRITSVRFVGLVAAIGFGAVPFAAQSLTSAGLLLFLPAAALAVRWPKNAKLLVTGCAALFLVGLAATIVVGSTYYAGDRSGLMERAVDATLTERRAVLWHEALVMMREHPATGAGLGSFQVLSATARTDRDARWAHNTFLQQGAEAGLVGLCLTVLLFVWGFVSLRTARRVDVVTVLGALGLAALGIHAGVDYVLHFPVVPLTAAALVGAAGAVQAKTDRTPVKKRSRAGV
jgi:O-antigen ligase